MNGFELQLCRIRQLTLTNFRNYVYQTLDLGDKTFGEGDIVALIGPNGAGKTNLLEAVSLFISGRGLRSSAWEDLSYKTKHLSVAKEKETGFTVSCQVQTGIGPRRLGIGASTPAADKRNYRLDGHKIRSAAAFNEFLAFVWLTPHQDGLFRNASEERRRFFDQLATALDKNYAAQWAAYQNSARQRLKLLKDAASKGLSPDDNWLSALEDSMARHGTTVAVARRAMVKQLTLLSERGYAPFPGAKLAVSGLVEEALNKTAAVDVEDQLRTLWREERSYDQRYGRTHSGPHRSDFLAWHSDHEMPARDCSTGEQKAMLIAILLAHAQLIENQRMIRPILLLDEATAHLDPNRREALLDVLSRFGGQCWLTGTDLGAFPKLESKIGTHVRLFSINNGTITAPN